MTQRHPDLYQPPAAPEGAPDRSAELRRIVAIGSAIALVVFLFPWSRFVFSYLGTLVHELGHAAVGIAFGHFSIPTFDFEFGGGYTRIGPRSTPLLILCLAALGWLLHRMWQRPTLRLPAIALGVGYGLILLTPLREMLIVAGGHASELLFAGIFLYRGLSGDFDSLNMEIERPLYVACAVFLLLEDAVLAWNLVTDQDHRAAYRMMKGGNVDGDLYRLANEFLGFSLAGVAALLLLATLLTPWITYLVHRRRAAMNAIEP